jgi:hypothetical protein
VDNVNAGLIIRQWFTPTPFPRVSGDFDLFFFRGNFLILYLLGFIKQQKLSYTNFTGQLFTLFAKQFML